MPRSVQSFWQWQTLITIAAARPCYCKNHRHLLRILCLHLKFLSMPEIITRRQQFYSNVNYDAWIWTFQFDYIWQISMYSTKRTCCVKALSYMLPIQFNFGYKKSCNLAPYYLHGLTDTGARINNYTHSFLWDVITWLCLYFSCGLTKLPLCNYIAQSYLTMIKLIN